MMATNMHLFLAALEAPSCLLLKISLWAIFEPTSIFWTKATPASKAASMAFPYPEGAVYFRTDALHRSGFNETSEKGFYGHFLVEYVWNLSVRQGGDLNHRPEDHPHSSRLHTGYGQCGIPDVAFGTQCTAALVTTGTDPSLNAESSACGTNTNFNELRDRDKGGPKKVHTLSRSNGA